MRILGTCRIYRSWELGTKSKSMDSSLLQCLRALVSSPLWLTSIQKASTHEDVKSGGGRGREREREYMIESLCIRLCMDSLGLALYDSMLPEI